MPCRPHKEDGSVCDHCSRYDRVESRILIVKLAALGDVLRTTGVLPSLASRYPRSSVTWVTRANARPLLARNPGVDRVLAVEENALEMILCERFDAGFGLDAEPLSASLLTLSRCRDKVGYVLADDGTVRPANPEAEAWFRMGIDDGLKRRNRKTYHRHVLDICRLGGETHPPLLNLDPEDRAFAGAFLSGKSRGRRRILGVNTGGGGRWRLKRWPEGRFVEFLRRFAERRPDVDVILFGGPEEAEMNRRILAGAPGSVIDAGCGNSIGRFAALVERVDVLLTSDSLAMHVGVALGRNTVVLAGPTSPWELDVFGRGEILFDEGLDCIACYRPDCDRKDNCMASLAPDRVASALERYL
jgi:ADP-heptose:LPS heptosyltransferase